MGLAQRDVEHHTYADYCSWPDDMRYELIDGVAYGVPDVRELVGTLAVDVLPEIVIDWERAVRELDD